MDNEQFSYDELIAAFEDAQGEPENDEGVLRTVEIAEMMGMSDRTVRKLLAVMKKKGLVEVGKKKILSISDITTTVTGYKLKSKHNGTN